MLEKCNQNWKGVPSIPAKLIWRRGQGWPSPLVGGGKANNASLSFLLHSLVDQYESSQQPVQSLFHLIDSQVNSIKLMSHRTIGLKGICQWNYSHESGIQEGNKVAREMQILWAHKSQILGQLIWTGTQVYNITWPYPTSTPYMCLTPFCNRQSEKPPVERPASRATLPSTSHANCSRAASNLYPALHTPESLYSLDQDQTVLLLKMKWAFNIK